ncbi:MAG TPA: matrixin family metalloprotease, partial [Myxococcus sp.]|nr:matrixin family metalloprotease [Myxococcus sp.]
AGEGLVMEALFLDGHSEQLHVETDGAGRVALGTRPTPPEPLSAGEHPTQAAACNDGAYNLFPFKWRGTLHWRFNAGSTPAELTVDGAEDKLRAAASNITGGQNDCGLTDAIAASHSYEGRTTRSVAISPTNGCVGSERDGVNVVGFGDLQGGTLGLACTWYSGDGAALESDIRLNKVDHVWTLNSESAGCSGRFGVEAVATHEFGHAFGLGHVSEADHAALTMSTAIAPCDASAATLGLGDVRGLRAKY